MVTKREVVEQLSRGEGCLGKAADDEPVFVLRGQDALAIRTIGFWRDELRKVAPNSPKLDIIHDELNEFLEWQIRHKMKWPD